MRISYWSSDVCSSDLKNRARVFEAAEDKGAVLLFDEADALFGKRSEVKDAHDRYANIEVAYLLERVERLNGLAIFAVGMRQNLDPAFLRRLRFTVDFTRPRSEEHTSELQSLMRISYAVFCLKKKKTHT